jgi:hypothetical protein
VADEHSRDQRSGPGPGRSDPEPDRSDREPARPDPEANLGDSEADLREPEADLPDPEPDEPHPESDLPDPESELPSVPSPPSPPSTPPESDVSTDLLKEFWALVLLANVALLGLTVGPMALYFLPEPRVGTALLAVGVFAAGAGVRRYRAVQAERAQ